MLSQKIKTEWAHIKSVFKYGGVLDALSIWLSGLTLESNQIWFEFLENPIRKLIHGKVNCIYFNDSFPATGVQWKDFAVFHELCLAYVRIDGKPWRDHDCCWWGNTVHSVRIAALFILSTAIFSDMDRTSWGTSSSNETPADDVTAYEAIWFPSSPACLLLNWLTSKQMVLQILRHGMVIIFGSAFGWLLMSNQMSTLNHLSTCVIIPANSNYKFDRESIKKMLVGSEPINHRE